MPSIAPLPLGFSESSLMADRSESVVLAPDQKPQCSQILGGRAGKALCDHLVEPLGFLGEVLRPRDGKSHSPKSHSNEHQRSEKNRELLTLSASLSACPVALEVCPMS